MNFSLGGDPEFMLSYHGELKSAIEILPKKENARKENGNQIYYDNVLAEFGIKPSFSKEEFLANIKNGLTFLSKQILPCKFVIRASADFPVQLLNNKDSKIISCNPVADAYTLRNQEMSEEVVEFKEGSYQFKIPFRSAGGHLHIGHELLKDQLNAISFIRMMDLFVAIPAVYLDQDATSYARKNIYGRAGSFRFCDFGVEYTTLSNFWLSSPDLAGLIYDLTEFVVEFIADGKVFKFWEYNNDFHNCFGYDKDLLINCINNSDKESASKFRLITDSLIPETILNEIDRLTHKPIIEPYLAWGIQ